MRHYLSQNSDPELWDLMRKGSKDAFALLYKRHIQSLFNFGLRLTTNRELVKDTLQDFFVDLWQKRNNRTAVQHVRSYLIKSFRNRLLRAIEKANKNRNYSFEELLLDLPETAQDKAALVRRKLLKEQVQNLPKRQREVVHLRYFQNLKNDEIAEILNINYQSVSNLLHRALEKLKFNFPTETTR